MKYHFQVPSVVCKGCSDTITEVIQTEDSEAKVNVDIDKKTVDVDTSMSEESVRQAIQSANHTIAA